MVCIMRRVKKQIWITIDEEKHLKHFANVSCLTEAECIRMLLRNRVPKEKPDAEFYEAMNQITAFSDQLQTLAVMSREADPLYVELLQAEIQRWHQFQLAIEERFLAPEKVPWL